LLSPISSLLPYTTLFRSNIGFVVLEQGSNGSGFADVRFTTDWRRALCFDPEIDLEWLKALEADIRTEIQRSPDRQAFMRKLEESDRKSTRLNSGHVSISY